MKGAMNYREALRLRPVSTVLGIACALGLFLYFVGSQVWRSFSIALHEEHASGIVTGRAPHDLIPYRYSVQGREYSGMSIGEDGHFYPAGSTVEVRYSSSQPRFSTLTEPLLFPGQLVCAVVIVGGLFLMARHARRR